MAASRVDGTWHCVRISKQLSAPAPQYTVEPTLTYTADRRLPLEVLTKSPFVYTGPNPGAFLMGALQGVLTHRGRLLPRVHPLTVSEATAAHPPIDRVFSWCFFYATDADDLILFLTHPCWLNRSDNPALLAFLLERAEELATSGACTRIQLEYHSGTSYVAYPTSLTPFSHDIQTVAGTTDDVARLHAHGFQEVDTIQSYEQSLPALETQIQAEQTSTAPFRLNNMTSSEFRTLHASPNAYSIQGFALARRDPFLSFTDPQSPDVVSAAYTRPRWLRRGTLAGYVRWIPNLLEPALAYRLPVPLLFTYAFETYAFTYGKIVDWGLSGDSDDATVFTALLTHVVHAMKARGLTRIQVGNVHGRPSPINVWLQHYDFQPVHTITLYEKPVR